MSYRSRFSSLFTYPPLTLGALAEKKKKVHPDWVIDAVDEISSSDCIVSTAALFVWMIVEPFRDALACV